MSNLTFDAIDVIVRLVVVFFMVYIMPVVKRLIEKILAEKWARDAVNAAQQVYALNTGAERKEYVLEELTKLLNKYKVNITEEQVHILIESAVKQLRIEEEKAKGKENVDGNTSAS